MTVGVRGKPRLPGWDFSTYTQTCIHECSVSLLPTRICSLMRLFASSHGYTQVYKRVRCTRTEGEAQSFREQDGRTKSLILNGARTDITRELEIDGGSKRRGRSERERESEIYYEERGGRRNLSRFNVEDRTRYRLVLVDNSGREREKKREPSRSPGSPRAAWS